MSAPLRFIPSVPSSPTPAVLRAFSRVYEPPEAATSYLDEIHIWSQRAKVSAVDWDVRADTGGFYATPIFPDLRGRKYPSCVGTGSTQDNARRHATQLLLQAGIDVNVAHVRWEFTQPNSAVGNVHRAVPIVYNPAAPLHNRDVIGHGPTKQEAKEDSAQKLLCQEYCWI